MLPDFSDSLDKLSEVFSNYSDAISAVKSYVENKDIFYWSSLEGDEPSRLVLSSYLSDIWYEDGMEGPDTKKMPGVVGVDEEGIRLVCALNQSKKAFESFMGELRCSNHHSRKDQLLELLQSGDASRSVHSRDLLRRFGIARINLLQMYRTFHVIESTPKSCSFTWARSNRSVKVVSPQEAIDLVPRVVNDPDRQYQCIDIIRKHGPDTLAIARPVSWHCKVNITMHDGERSCLVAHSPIFYLMEPGKGNPSIRWRARPNDDEKAKSKRANRRISDVPLIGEMNLYDYI